MRKKRVLWFSLLLLYTIAVPVFAYMYFYMTDLTVFGAGVNLEVYPTPTMQLGFYWDEACTQNVTTFDFGNMTHPQATTILWKIIYIRNEGSVWNDIYWNSTLNSATDQITEVWSKTWHWDWWSETWYIIWDPSFNGTRLQPNQVIKTGYGISIPPYSPAGTFNWTLTVWGENYY